MTLEICEKISKGCQGRIVSEEIKAKISKSTKNRIFTEEHRKNLSEALRIRMSKPEEKAKLIAFHTGRKRTAETKLKMSKAALKNGSGDLINNK